MLNKAKEFVAETIAQVKKPEAELSDLVLDRLDSSGAAFRGRVSVRNPYHHSIPICEVSYSLQSAGREIAAGTMPDPGSLKASDVTELVVPVRVPYDFLVSLLRDVGRDWDMDYEIRVGLTIDLPVVGNFTLPVSNLFVDQFVSVDYPCLRWFHKPFVLF
ncbi:Late embryogenesis abundant protein Lea14-A [Apostasia shenzhenica]|uniref:Late embryogenesis abundant protein Lea14-A n=1 Tax=Apostasia shenzhenica TaxID=1088818 RepID=A0A2I0B6R3_9ASPA|nr:Late embryogenesis abundant protein Lea14-A [Apostasia shenzhenica]